MTDGPLFDEGLQPERTELAWRRTALAIATGALVSLRLLPELLGSPLWVGPGIAGVLFSAAMWFGARRRHRRFMTAMSSSNTGMLPDGRQLFALALFCVVCGLGALFVSLLQR